eukprot:Lithocolla_globosa_v1_NODE_7609_length_924_cov_8.813579.p1 type:complete len:147 gc:universal NODE_7609_length_924_cov_8.813579:668-228(-)
MRKEHIDAEVERLKDNGYENSLPQTSVLFRPVKESAKFVHKILMDLQLLPVHLRKAYVFESKRLLTRKAIALIKYVQSEMIETDVIGLTLLSFSLKKIRQDLGLDDNNLFFTVLAVAENLEPGAFQNVIGDPHSMEEKFREMIESF